MSWIPECLRNFVARSRQEIVRDVQRIFGEWFEMERERYPECRVPELAWFDEFPRLGEGGTWRACLV